VFSSIAPQSGDCGRLIGEGSDGFAGRIEGLEAPVPADYAPK
jgi:hypothetical protein